MLTLAEVRRIALSLPEVTEEGHFGIPSFRIGKKIFATVPDQESLRIMLGPEEIAAATSTDPEAFEELWWGKQLAGIVVHLAKADGRQVKDLLGEAWRRKAPRTLAAKLTRGRFRTVRVPSMSDVALLPERSKARRCAADRG